ncbi:hypothetical protein ACFVFJ_03605 [Streptomyces sp. NPDC057717]|uniref:hypothetical protein n=1 Tax=unclassified Streptomyces TaxID=2593676 RepID=UPI003647FB34
MAAAQIAMGSRPVESTTDRRIVGTARPTAVAVLHDHSGGCGELQQVHVDRGPRPGEGQVGDRDGAVTLPTA